MLTTSRSITLPRSPDGDDGDVPSSGPDGDTLFQVVQMVVLFQAIQMVTRFRTIHMVISYVPGIAVLLEYA